MNWKHKTIIRILMIIAKMYAEDSELRKELETLGNHMSAGFTV